MSTIRTRWLKAYNTARGWAAVARLRYIWNPTPLNSTALANRRAAVAFAGRVLKRHPPSKPVVQSERLTWHPKANASARYTSAGPFTVGRPKIVWHTTEGSSLPVYSGSAPHFTFNPKSGELWQHIPLNEASKALKHVGGPETNKAHAIQVELIGRASETGLWPTTYYNRIAELARWIETNAGIPRTCGVKFAVPATRLSGQGFVDYTGHCGHEHVPGQDHWDPGTFRISAVL